MELAQGGRENSRHLPDTMTPFRLHHTIALDVCFKYFFLEGSFRDGEECRGFPATLCAGTGTVSSIINIIKMGHFFTKTLRHDRPKFD